MYKNLLKVFSLCLVLGISFNTVALAHVDLTKLPLGDGKTTTTTPAVGMLYVCQNASGGGGSNVNGPWINGDTWDYTKKLQVSGDVKWPDAKVSFGESQSMRVITGNGLPTTHNTGTYPISSADPVLVYDANPNSISSQNVNYSIPLNPQIAATPTCVNGGPIGVTLSGVLFFNGVDGENRDAVAHEAQDKCDGHPERTGQYHYHNMSRCLDDSGTGHSKLLGYAFDGFGIYGNRGDNGASLTNSDLDVCHGHVGKVMWDGKEVEMYHYHGTYEFPYTVGCFKGTPIKMTQGGGMAGNATTPSNSNATIMPILPATVLKDYMKLGSTGTNVITLQNLLISKGFLKMSATQTKGYFGAMTKTALMKFQKANKISTTGTLGPVTLKAVNAILVQIPDSTQNSNMPSASGNTQSGAKIMNPNMTVQNPGGQPSNPPKEAIDACTGKAEKATCAFTGMQGEKLNGSCMLAPLATDKVMACRPEGMMKPQ